MMGYPSVDTLLSGISAKEKAEWERFNELNPPPETQIMLCLSTIACTFANCYIKRKDGQDWTIKHFFPNFLEESEEDTGKGYSERKKVKVQSPEAMKNVMTTFANIFGGGLKRKKRKKKKRPDSSNESQAEMPKRDKGKGNVHPQGKKG